MNISASWNAQAVWKDNGRYNATRNALVDIVALYFSIDKILDKRLIPMNKIKKILIALAVLILLIGIIVVCELVLQRRARDNMTYEQYNAMSAEEQEKFFHLFDTVEEFFAWYNKAKQEYEDNQDYTEIGGDGNINIGETEKSE